MQLTHGGFTWEVQPVPAGQKPATRTQAIDAIQSVPPVGQRSEAYAQAWAAFNCADYGRVLDRVEHARDYAEARS